MDTKQTTVAQRQQRIMGLVTEASALAKTDLQVTQALGVDARGYQLASVGPEGHSRVLAGPMALARMEGFLEGMIAGLELRAPE